ncbi:MAG: nicotinate-nucleotide adenylyltransferase [Bacteroidota bacterium]|nr:nicotinate-nucleotide adenylyltransferase [Bacteroidota bacterium]
MNIGIFGGTFNPPHVGHLIVAEHVRQAVKLDEIIFVPSFISPHKRAGEEREARARLAMVKLAIEGNSRFTVSDIELKRKGTSYTFETVESLHREYLHAALFFLIGMDNFIEFQTWKSPERIVQQAKLVVMNRPSYQRTSERLPFFESALFVDVPNIELSSSEIRAAVKARRPIRYLVPSAVEHYIMKHRLYTS